MGKKSKKDKETLLKILLLFQEAEQNILELDKSTLNFLHDYHNERYGLPHCIRWGLTACEEIIEEF